MSDRTDADSLSDIQEATRRIVAYTAGMTYAAFVTDIKTQDTVIRNLQIMGEATKNLSHEVQTNYSDMPWRSMAGVRDRLVHHYFGVNFDIVWQIVTGELPNVASQVDKILGDETS